MSTIRLYLKGNEKIFINGAVLQVDRKVGIDLLNDATFLLGQNIIQQEEADTPLKQLYFATQLMMMHPADREDAFKFFKTMVRSLLENLETPELIVGVKAADVEVRTGKEFNALKIIRSLFPMEETIMRVAKPEMTRASDIVEPPKPELQLSQA